MPVDAASKAPTATTDTAKPPGRPPNRLAIEVNNSSAIFDRSNAIPMRTNNGTANRVSFWFSPNALIYVLDPHCAKILVASNQAFGSVKFKPIW